MSTNLLDEFAQHLINRNYLAPDSAPASLIRPKPAREPGLRRLWEATDLSANGFADEVAHFYGMTRLSLPDLVAAKALTDRFSPRFLRETVVFPYHGPDGSFRLAVADPGDRAAVRAAEIVLGGEVAVAVASFEDIAIILGERLGGDEATPQDPQRARASADDDIESLRDLASGAPVVRAVNGLLEKAVELRASDIHIEPFRSGLDGAHAHRRALARRARAPTTRRRRR